MRRIAQKGVAALELAILIVPLLLIAFGASELGRAFYYYNTLLKSTRDAARYISLMPRGEGVDNDARCLAVFGRMPCTDIDHDDSLLPGLTTAMVSIPPAAPVDLMRGSDNLGTIYLVTVTITGYPFVPLAPFLASDPLSLRWEAFTFGDLSTTMAHLL